MVLFSIHLRPHSTTKDLKARLIGTGIHTQEIRLKGYFVHFKTGTSANVRIPNLLFAKLDFLGNQVHNASSASDENQTLFPHINYLPLPLSNETYTNMTGLDISFMINGKIDRDITATIYNYDNNNSLEETKATTTASSSLANDDNNAYLTSLVLLFEYDKVGNF